MCYVRPFSCRFPMTDYENHVDLFKLPLMMIRCNRFDVELVAFPLAQLT